MTKTWLAHKSITIPPSTLPLDQQSQAIETGLQRYATIRNGYAGIGTATDFAKAGMGAAIGGLILYGGLQASVSVPLTLMGGLSAITLELTGNRVEEIGNQRSQAFLASLANDIVAEAGVASFSTLANNPQLLINTVRNSNLLLADVKARAIELNDPALLTMAVDVLARTATATDEATLAALVDTGADLGELESEFGEFIEEMRASNERIESILTDHTAAVEAIREDAEQLDERITTADVQIETLGANQGLIVDFMFSGLPPAEKAAALRSGLLDSRIQCPPERPDCDLVQIREALVERFEAEGRIQANIATAGKILSGINDIQTITSNLGIDLGADGNKALEVGAAAVGAYVNFISGNYLGAIASVSSLFVKKSDPDAERFKIMMGYLQEQFGIVNRKLDVIIENQKVILEAVKDVSEQLRATYEALDQRLANMEYEQAQISDNLKQLIWRDWTDCYSVYRYATVPDASESQPSLVNLDTMLFPSFDAVRSVIDATEDQARACQNLLITAGTSLSAMDIFGNFLDADLIFNEANLVEESTLTSAVDGEAERYFSLARRHRENLVDPSTAIVVEWAFRNSLSASTLLWLLTSRIESVADVQDLLERVESGRLAFSCTSDDNSMRAIRGLACADGPGGADKIAAEVLTANVNIQMLLAISEWTPVIAQVSDLYLSGPSGFAKSLEELSTSNFSRGRAITAQAVNFLTLGLSFQSKLHGGLTGYIVADDLLSGRGSANHRRLLENNPYTAENTAIAILHLKRATWNLRGSRFGPTFEDVYFQSIEYAKVEADDRFQPLNALFGQDLKFSPGADGRLMLVMLVDGVEVMLPMPLPKRLVEGRFEMTPRTYEVLSRRQVTIERYLDYILGADKTLALAVLER